LFGVWRLWFGVGFIVCGLLFIVRCVFRFRIFSSIQNQTPFTIRGKGAFVPKNTGYNNPITEKIIQLR